MGLRTLLMHMFCFSKTNAVHGTVYDWQFWMGNGIHKSKRNKRIRVSLHSDMISNLLISWFPIQRLHLMMYFGLLHFQNIPPGTVCLIPCTVYPDSKCSKYSGCGWWCILGSEFSKYTTRYSLQCCNFFFEKCFFDGWNGSNQW